MATAFKSLDTRIPFTSAPKPNIRVVWSQGAAMQAVATKLAAQPAAQATLEELQIADLTRGVIATARQLLSPRMYAAFLRWGEAAIPFSTSDNEEGNEELANTQCEANSATIDALAATPTCNEHDVALKHYILALENTASPTFGPVLTDMYESVSKSADLLVKELGADLPGIAPLNVEIDQVARQAVVWSGGTLTYAAGLGRAMVDVFTEARQLLEEEGEPTAKPLDLSAYDMWMRGPLIAWNRQYDRVIAAEDDLRACDRDVHSPTHASASDADEATRDAVQAHYDVLVTVMYDELHRLWLLPAPGAGELATKLKLIREHGGMGQGDADAYVDALTIDARRFGSHGAHLQTDESLLKAFAASRAAEMAVMHEPRPLCGDEFSEHFDQSAAAEEVIFRTRATTIEGVLAKLRVGFAHGLDGDSWRNDAIIDPASARFREGIAEDDYFARMLWSGIEDLARMGGVNLSEQGR